MGLDRKGSQFRIRVRPPSKFSKLRTKDVGMKGGLKLIVGRLKGKKTTTTQSIRVSTRDFKRVKGKLIAKTTRGMRETRSLKTRRSGPMGRAVKRYL